MIVGMTRQPVMVGLDLKCEMAANNVARMRMEEMYGQYGAELVDAVSKEMIRYSESILRRRVREVKDGEWGDSAVIEGGEKWRVELRLRKVGDRLVFDFTGTDKQARTGINLPYHATFGACYEVVLGTLGYDIPKNHGVMRPLEVIAPEGTIVNVKPPGPVSMNTTSGGQTVKFLVKSVLTQMLATSERWRGEVLAHSVGQRLARHAGINQYGRYYASGFALGAFAAGGATTCRDGVDSGHGAHLTCPNVEWSELNFPLLHLFRRHMRDGAGAGKFRGGAGGETAVVVHDAPEGKVKVVAYGVAGLANSGRGIFGGYPGGPSVIILREGTKVAGMLGRGHYPEELSKTGGKARLLPYCDFDLSEGDILYMCQSNGGGYGDPLERDAGMVMRDVVDGVVSREAARAVYGVMLDRRGRLDAGATERQRGAMRKRRLRGAFAGKMIGEDGRGASYPPSEVVEVWEENGRKVVRCVRCRGELGESEGNWREGCRVKRLLAAEAGPLLKEFVGRFVVQQFYCPSCGALLESGRVEKKKGSRPQKRAVKPGLGRATSRSAGKNSG
jgi:N-methylhydantoinase B